MGLKSEGKGLGMMFLGFANLMLCLSTSLPCRPQEFPCPHPIPTSSMFLNLLGSHTLSSQMSDPASEQARVQPAEISIGSFLPSILANSLWSPWVPEVRWKVWWTDIYSSYSDYTDRSMIENFYLPVKLVSAIRRPQGLWALLYMGSNTTNTGFSFHGLAITISNYCLSKMEYREILNCVK